MAQLANALAAIQHAERTSLLGRQLQPADGARRWRAAARPARTSHAPERSACSCAHSGRCVRTMSMRSSATPCACERRRERLVRRRHPGAPARGRELRQRGQRGQQ